MSSNSERKKVDVRASKWTNGRRFSFVADELGDSLTKLGLLTREAKQPRLHVCSVGFNTTSEFLSVNVFKRFWSNGIIPGCWSVFSLVVRIFYLAGDKLP